MNDFIKQQQELAREIMVANLISFEELTPEEEKAVKRPHAIMSNLDFLIKTAITNIGEELMRRAEGEREKVLFSPDYETGEEYGRRLDVRNQALDTLKKHITNVTGVE